MSATLRRATAPVLRSRLLRRMERTGARIPRGLLERSGDPVSAVPWGASPSNHHIPAEKGFVRAVLGLPTLGMDSQFCGPQGAFDTLLVVRNPPKPSDFSNDRQI
jgi:hypothetical protein